MGQVAERDTAGTAPARSWAGPAGCAWALGYVPIHVYWALTGSAWPSTELPESLSDSQWRQANWAACVVIIGAGVVAVALVRPWGRLLPRPMLLGVAWVGAGFAVVHWVAFSAPTLLAMVGVIDEAATSFDRWNLFVFEPWFLGMGVLLAVAAFQNTRANRGWRASNPVSGPRSVAGIASAVLILGGSFVVLVGVMTFRVWVYVIVGPVLIGLGMLCRLLARRNPLPGGR